tara:strand:+ start:341 stop:1072 length:732 start_codon:yes stop_codon:yes gene_type:complete
MCSIFILCYNEEILLPHTINHYKTNIPNCKITILDNKSTDNSQNIAKSMDCNIIEWSSDRWEGIDDFKYKDLKNNCWKDAEDGWIIVCDMDEWLCITEKELEEEKQNGTTILDIKGFEILGTSTRINLTDINLHELNRGYFNNLESKKLCFLKNEIKEMNYTIGAHKCKPIGNIKYSKKKYYNKHLNYLGENYYIDKILKRNERAKNQHMNKPKLGGHYIDKEIIIKRRYMGSLKKSFIFNFE